MAGSGANGALSLGIRRPIEGAFRVTSDTREHAERGIGPATDYARPEGALPIGTPIIAPFAVSGFHRWGHETLVAGGLALNATSPDGRMMFVGQHLSGYADVSGTVPVGGVIAFSGNTGSATTGPHLHCYVVEDGVRMSMEEAVHAHGLLASSGQPATLFSLTHPEDDMFTQEDRAILAMLAARTAAPTIPLLVQTADSEDDRLFVLMDTGQIRHIGPTEKLVYVRRAEQLGYAAEDFDRLFTSRIAGLGKFPGFDLD